MSTFSVQVPHGLSTGDEFSTTVNGQPVLVTVPRGNQRLIQIQVPVREHATYMVAIPPGVKEGEQFLVDLGGEVVWMDVFGEEGSKRIVNHKGIPLEDTGYKWPSEIQIPEWIEDDEETPIQFLCPITNCIMKRPTVTLHGMTYDYKAITRWLSIDMRDPLTKQRMERECIAPNRALHDLICEYVEGRRLQC